MSGARLIPGGGCVLVLQRVQANAEGLLHVEPELLSLDSRAQIVGRKKMNGESNRQATLFIESSKVILAVGEASFQCNLSDLK